MPFDSHNRTREIGRVRSFYAGVARIEGLPFVGIHELLVDEQGRPMAISLGFDAAGVDALFFDQHADPDQPVYRGKHPISIPASDRYSGRVVNGLGAPRDGYEALEGPPIPLFRESPALMDRSPVCRPLTTGIKIVDATLSLGRGQRELVIGDRKLGKTTLAVDVILNQRRADPPVVCILVLCGKKQDELSRLIRTLEQYHSTGYTAVVAAAAADSYAAQYLAPFVGCAIGEFLRDHGHDVLIVYDDLTKHADIYRDISLLLKRSPGREAYPGDIFSLHAGLLERAAQLSAARGGGSLTAIPIIETQEGDLTTFISTNMISITDGQLYFEQGLFQKGFRPAINIGLSVSRIGAQAQPRALAAVTGGLRITLSQYQQLQKLAQLDTAVSDAAKRNIHRGELTLELLKQPRHTAVSWEEQTILFLAVENGLFDTIDQARWSEFEHLLLQLMRTRYQPILQYLKHGEITDQLRREVLSLAQDFRHEFLQSDGERHE